MYPIKPIIGVEPTDPYEKAKKDIYTALNSISALSPPQREMLARELLGVADFAAFVKLAQFML